MSVSEVYVPRKATILNCCTATESRRNVKDGSLGTPATETSRSPSSSKKHIPSALIGPMVSKATGIKKFDGSVLSPVRKPVGSLVAGISIRCNARHIRSLTWSWRVDRSRLYYYIFSTLGSKDPEG